MPGIAPLERLGKKKKITTKVTQYEKIHDN